MVGEWTDRVDERVDKITVHLTPPQQHDVNDVVVLVTNEVLADNLVDGISQAVVNVLVVPQLLNGHPRLNAELGRYCVALASVGRHRTCPSHLRPTQGVWG